MAIASSKPAHVSPVTRKILWWLLRYPLQRVEDLTLALGVSTNTVYRHLNRLVEASQAEYITPSLNVQATCRLYYLSNDGLLASAALERADARALASQWGSHEQGLQRLIPRLSTLIPLQNVINGLIAQASSMLAHAGGYRADISWHWRRDYRHSFSSQESSLTWSADVALLFYRKASPLTARTAGSSGAAYYCALLFCDGGLSGLYDHQFIAQRLEMLMRYREQTGRTGSSPAAFPPLIVVTQTPLQQETWQRCAADLAVSMRAAPLTGAILCLDEQTTMESVWTLPWQQLAVRASCRLRDLFSPLPEEALPPGLLKRQPAVPSSEPSTKNTPLVRGNFSQRAQKLSAALAEDEDLSEREVAALLGLCLSQRHRDILQLCYTYPLLAQSEIAALSGLQPESVARYLRELRRYDCIKHAETDDGTRWHVSERGLRLLAATLHAPLQRLAERSETGEHLVQRGLPEIEERIAQTTGLYTFLAQLAAETHRQPDHELLWWEMGPRAERRFQDHGTWLTLRPAASFAYKTPTATLRAWIAWEAPEASNDALSASMHAYARYIKAREWTATGVQSPPILHLVIPENEPRLPQIAREHLSGVGLLVRVASARHLAERGPLAPIWTQMLPQPSRSATIPPRRGLLDLSLTSAAR